MKQYTIFIPLNPQAWNTPPYFIGRRGGKQIVMSGRDEENHAFKEAIKEELIKAKAEMIEPPYEIELYIWRKIEHGRKAVDLTNMQKLIEDSLQGTVIDNDRNVVKFSTTVVEQTPDSPQFFIVTIKRVDYNIKQFVLDNLNKLFGPVVSYLAQERINGVRLADQAQQFARHIGNSWPPK